MKFFRITFVVFLLGFGISNPFTSNAQDYKTGIGIRLGGITQGITVKHFMNSNGALEGILSFGHSTFRITGLYEWQNSIPNAPGLAWFVGGGAHIGFYNDGYGYYYNKHHGHYGSYYYYDDGSSQTVLGLDFIIGMEYKIPNAPISLGLDLKPFFDLTDNNFFYWDGAFTARYVF